MKCSVFIAASVDGFIARLDGDIDWLFNPEYAADDGAGPFGYAEFIASVDVLVMGRNSFEKVLSFPTWPYEKTPVIVLSTRELTIPEHLAGTVTVENSTPQELVARLESEGRTHLYIDGGVTIQRFLQAKLIDEMTITRIPVLLWEGIPLFGFVGEDVQLIHRKTLSFDNGFVQTRYGVRIASAPARRPES
ncbi:MAG: dihydrofolate reductase [Gemmatimonadaceae bacterium]|nr:dihydrofolate reductase [Gemmatimonadaceae bacterium]